MPLMEHVEEQLSIWNLEPGEVPTAIQVHVKIQGCFTERSR